jgi:hypothetical protein
MSYNLFVAFETHDPVREASLVNAAIEDLGQSVRLFSTYWYVRSPLTAAEAARQLWEIMEPSDTLIVVNATMGEAAAFNVDDSSMDWMQKRWHLRIDERRARVPELVAFHAASASGAR